MSSSASAPRQPLGAISNNSIVNSADPTSGKQLDPANKKRKASEPAKRYHFDDDICQMPDIDCDEVRAKIRALLESGEIKVGEFQHTIDVKPTAYKDFMKQDGYEAGHGSGVYRKAFAYFKCRELNGVHIAKKKKVEPSLAPASGSASASASTNAMAETDFGDIILEDEEENDVPVYDSCGEIRKKIRKYLAKTGMSQSAFSKEIGKMFHPAKKTVSGLAPFLAKKGPAAGNTTGISYGSYVFFEKMRIRDRKPKSEHRLGMEDAWNGFDFFRCGKPGMETKKMIDRETYFVPVGSRVELYQDEFGKARSMRY